MTHLTVLDGSIIGVYLLITMIAGVAIRRYVRRVEDFIVAGREMNVYLGIASLAATEFGIVTCMYAAQNGFDKGFAGAVPGLLTFAGMYLVGVTGFCVKPLRDSGVMTIPELFEKKYGPRVRWAAGVVIVLGGLLNMGVFLRMGGDFLVNVAHLDAKYLEVMMTVLLAGVAIYTILGGMLSVLVTDFLQFIVMSAGLIITTFLILDKVGWGTLVNTVETHHGAGGFNPFANPTMGWSYVIFNALLNTAATLTWQTQIARVLAAKDSATGRKVYTRTSFFFVARWLIPGIWGIAALAMLTPEQVPQDSILAMPKMLGMVLPAGLMGLLIAAMLAADMSTDSSYMLTWSSVIYNDILAPFRKTKWSEKKGLAWNRAIVAAIGVFLLIYGLWYKIEGDAWTYLGITGTIYLASMSTLLVACCYWKRANSWGATAAIVFGALMPVAVLVLQKVGPWTAWVKENEASCMIAVYATTAVAMIVGSLLKPHAQGFAGDKP
ncbi:MAG: sodium:solute symporter family protein [Phycisphaerae bacterium]|nr:sodium:solute symporter family protein [Phycisphaerae bacterium]